LPGFTNKELGVGNWDLGVGKMVKDIDKINSFLQAELRNRGMESVASVEAADWLDRKGLLKDRKERAGVNLRKLMRQKKGLIKGQRQEPNGRWFIDRVSTERQIHEEFFIDSIEPFISDKEGKKALKFHLTRERSSKLIRSFKNSLATFECRICGFDFKKIYGDIGEKFIEAHHSRPVSKFEVEEEVSIEDLVAICSNCHRMIHRLSPMPNWKEFKNILRSHR